MVAFFIALSVFFLKHKKEIEAQEEEADDPDAMSMKQTMRLAATEAVDNVTGSMGSVCAVMWFGLVPGVTDHPGSTTGLFLLGTIILCALEYVERTVKKGGVAKNVLGLLGTAIQGTFAWHIASAMYNIWQGIWNATPDTVTYGNFVVILVSAALHMEIYSF